MAIIERDREPGANELKYFGLMMGAFFALIGGLIFYRTRRYGVPGGLWTFGAIITLLYYALPNTQRMMFQLWMTITYPLGFTVSHIVLGFFYYCIFTPIGFVMRTFGRDPMQRRFEPKRVSYWVERKHAFEPNRYWRQF
jgi:hypothetical protein